MKKILSIIGVGILLLLGAIIYSLTTRNVSGFQDQTSFALPKPTFNTTIPTLQEPPPTLSPAMPPMPPMPPMPTPATPPIPAPPMPAMPSMPAMNPPPMPAMPSPPMPPMTPSAMPPMNPPDMNPPTPAMPTMIPPPSVPSTEPIMQGMTSPKISGFSNYNGSTDSDLGGYSSYPF